MADFDKKEGKGRRGEGTHVELEVGETKEERETEFKILGSWEKTLKRKLREMGARKIFDGMTETTWFKNGLPRGVSARIRKSVDGSGKVKYTWTIKCDPMYTNGASARGLRDKFERTGREKGFKQSKAKLMSELEKLGVDIPKTLQKPTLVVGKHRTSYAFEEGEHAELRLDFDSIIEVNGKTVRPLELMEIEDTSDSSVLRKETKTMNCVIDLGFDETHIDTEFAYMSTEQLLNRLGYIQKRAVVASEMREGDS